VRKRHKILALAATAALIVGGVATLWVYEAAQHVPAFYRDAVELDVDDQTPARDEFVAQLTALASDLNHQGPWQTLFTADQINAWLALELKQNYPDMLSEGFCDPRISLRANEATIACRYETEKVSAIVSLTVDAYLHEPHVLALRIRRARAGALPLPLGQILDGVSHVARHLNLRLDWRKSHGDPVALITLPQPHASERESLSLQTIELRENELFVSGAIGAPPAIVQPSRPVEEERPTADITAAQPVVGATEKETRQK
jgi:hypothetical protein